MNDNERPSRRPRPDSGERKPYRSKGKPGEKPDSKPTARREYRAGAPEPRNRNHRERDRIEETPSRPDWQARVDRPIKSDRPKSPLIPEEVTPEDLPMSVRAQLKTLTAENASMTARHLAMAALLFDQDPELAHAHAVAAVNRAGRIAVVRETVAITAYQVEDWAMCLRELLAHRRMTGSNEYIAMMVDCERGLGRPAKGIELARTVDRSGLSPEAKVKLAIALSGARLDLGQNQEALVELEIRELDPTRVFEYSAQLFYAYADTLDLLGRETDSKRWLDLAKRAESAVAPKLTAEDEQFLVIEELSIPTVAERPKREFDGAKRNDRSSQRNDRGPQRGDRGLERNDRGSKRSEFGAKRNDGGPKRFGDKRGR